MSENESAPADSTPEAESEEHTAAEPMAAETAVATEAAGAGGAVAEPVAADTAPAAEPVPVPPEEITYHAVEKDGQVTAIWEMQGRKHMRTIDPRSRQGQEILRLYTSDHHDETPAHEAASI